MPVYSSVSLPLLDRKNFDAQTIYKMFSSNLCLQRFLIRSWFGGARAVREEA